MFSDLEELSIQCPYCGETISLLLDIPSGSQSYYEDCSVCCSPIYVQIEVDENDQAHVACKRDED
ncbi:CPXCG motif-containing cysteine-rich protein [Methylotuvimicrobium sp. KM1]|uniref:CPXCG motif-containing cysteine-rich protein n=1 Tax=Methylotuvimicrobium sp. KM1 TaxID=3377707 RepID=UPI00384BFD8F